MPFSGALAVFANPATTAPLTLCGEAARSVAVLARKIEKEDEQPLRVFLGDYPPKPSTLVPTLLRQCH